MLTAAADAPPVRERLHGVRQIVRFNWPFYAAGLPLAAAAPFVIERLPLGTTIRVVLHAGAALAWLWAGGSLLASWLVYDRSNLMTGEWLVPALGRRPGTWISIHAGLDELSPRVREVFGSPGRVFDIFDASVMTEPSIARARKTGPATSQPVDFRRLPVETGSVNTALLLLSAHELRPHEARVALLRELRRSLAGGGRIVVAEHLRDVPNFLAFGPGFLHFHSRRTWIGGFAASGLDVLHECSITPFVRIFVLRGRTDDRG